MTIRMLITGGTFDKEYDELTGELIFKDTHVPEMLKLGRCRLDIKIKKVMLVDSTNIKDSDIISLLKHCKKSKEDKIVIIHGTDTIVDTARFLGKSIKRKTIVLTGALIPYSFGNSDGLFNLGNALAFVQILPPGVYISMHGKYFNWNNIRKNKQKGEFEQIN
jgi:L-asparaginase